LAVIHHKMAEGKTLTAVVLNVYDLNAKEGKGVVTGLNDLTKHVGIGVFHSGIQVGTNEYFYGYRETGSGVCRCKPKKAVPEVYRFRDTVEVGQTAFTAKEVHKLVLKMSKWDKYQGPSYDLTRNNCNSFSDDLCQRLTGKSIPPWINRTADGVTVVRDGFNAVGKGVSDAYNSKPVQNVVQATNTQLQVISDSEAYKKLQMQSAKLSKSIQENETVKGIGASIANMWNKMQVASVASLGGNQQSLAEPKTEEKTQQAKKTEK